jgi:serine protease Do
MSKVAPRPLALAACAALSLAAAAIAQDAAQPAPRKIDIVTLVDGRAITAPIIKETAEKLWLDLGDQVLEVPRSRIDSILRADAQDQPGEADDQALYRVAKDLAESTPKELSKRLGEAVIMVSTPSGLGSGFIIHPDGYAITNAHVIQGETKLKGTVYEQTDRDFRRLTIEDVEILAVNDHLDLALIKLKHPDGKAFRTVPVQGAEDLAAGQGVFAIGSPLGLERTLSGGVIATTQRNLEGLTFIQTTAEINPGNSGGPLFNLKGEVIGVTNMKIPLGEGLGFAIPARYVRDFLRNRDAFAYDKDNPNSGHSYKKAPPRTEFGKPPMLDDATSR